MLRIFGISEVMIRGKFHERRFLTLIKYAQNCRINPAQPGYRFEAEDFADVLMNLLRARRGSGRVSRERC